MFKTKKAKKDHIMKNIMNRQYLGSVSDFDFQFDSFFLH